MQPSAKIKNAFTQRVFNLRTFTNSPLTFANQRVDNTADEWRLNAEVGTHPKKQPHPGAPSSLPKTPLNEFLRVLARKQLEHVHASKERAKSQKAKTDKYVPSFCTSFRLSKVRSSETDSLADHIDQRKDKYQVPNDLTQSYLPVHQIFKLKHVRAVGYRTYRLNNCPPRGNDSVPHYILKNVRELRLQMKTHSFDTVDQVSGFRTTFRLACNANHIREGAVMQTVSHFVADSVASSVDGRMVQSDAIKRITSTASSNRATVQAPGL